MTISSNIQHFWTWKFKKPYILWNNFNGLNDKNNVLEPLLLWPIWEFFSIRENWFYYDPIIEWSKVDKLDLKKLEEWYEKFIIENTYPSLNSEYKKWEIFNQIEKRKWNYDFMNLVEISVWKLLESKLNEWKAKDSYVILRTTTKEDDIKWWIDYIVEFYENWKLDNVVWIDVTTSRKSFINKENKHRDFTFPRDYCDFYRKKTWEKLKKMPRIILEIPKDISYSYTNEFFKSVLEEWNALNDEHIKDSFGYWLDELSKKNIINNKINYNIENVIDFSKISVWNILSNNYNKDGRR